MLKCEEVLDKMSDYIDNYLPENEKIEFENHMKTCKACEKEFDDLEKIILKLKHIEDLEPPEYLKDSIMMRIKQEEKTSKNNIIVFKRYSSLVATLLVFVVGGYIVNYNNALEPKSSVKLVQPSNSTSTNNDDDDNTSDLQDNSMIRGIITEEDQINPIGNNISSITKDIINNDDENMTYEMQMGDMPIADIPEDDNFIIDPSISIANNNLEFFGKTLFKEENLSMYSYRIDFMQGQEDYKVSFVNESSVDAIIKFKDEAQNEMFERIINTGDEINFYKNGDDVTIMYVHENDIIEQNEEFSINKEFQDIIYYVMLECDSENVLEGTLKIQEIIMDS
ncbi:MAG: zf-HC2 domain-containing protein [bacterium]